jgi:hypothetical protein
MTLRFRVYFVWFFCVWFDDYEPYLLEQAINHTWLGYGHNGLPRNDGGRNSCGESACART